MGSPMISVVMSIYNEPEEWLKDSIESILNQTFTDLEFIIVNDNPGRSINGKIIQHYQSIDSRIVLLENAENMGLTRSLNRAFKEARGIYIARMDADDVSLPKRLEIQYEFMEENPDIGVCGSWIRYFGAINRFSKRTNKLPLTPRDIQTTFLFTNPLVHPTTFFRRSILDSTTDIYDPLCRSAQDYLLWDTLSHQSIRLANVGAILLRYRVSNDQISNKLKNNQNTIANTIQLRALEKVGITFAESDKELYVKILNNNPLNNIESFEHAERILLDIRTRLSGIESFNSYLVDKYIHAEWVSCFKHVQIGKRPWKKFVFSPLFKLSFLGLRDFGKIVLSR